MQQWANRKWVAAALAAVLLGATGAFLVMRQSCATAGGQFVWTQVACEVGSRPVILQGDIHRV